jgi:hypothetical protein
MSDKQLTEHMRSAHGGRTLCDLCMGQVIRAFLNYANTLDRINVQLHVRSAHGGRALCDLCMGQGSQVASE